MEELEEDEEDEESKDLEQPEKMSHLEQFLETQELTGCWDYSNQYTKIKLQLYMEDGDQTIDDAIEKALAERENYNQEVFE